MELLASLGEKFKQWFAHAKPECRCQVRDCWEGLRWLYLTNHRVMERDFSADATARPMRLRDLLQVPKEFWNFIRHPVRSTKEDAAKEKLNQDVVFKTCNEHREENSFETQRCLRALGWYLEESSQRVKPLFPTWVIVAVAIYALLLIWAITSGDGISIPFLDPDFPLLW